MEVWKFFQFSSKKYFPEKFFQFYLPADSLILKRTLNLYHLQQK